MGCPCQATKAKQYKYVDENGQETIKATEVEATVLKIRNDNKGKVVPVKV